MVQRVAVLVVFVLVLSVPFMVRLGSGGVVGTERAHDGGGAARLIVVTPHVEQIREEFGRAFSAWHERVHGEPAVVDWRTPGGTSEIVKQLEAQFEAAARDGRLGPDGVAQRGAIGYDVFFGGGSFEHKKMGARQTVATPAGAIGYTMGQPLGWPQARLDEVYGPNKIGIETLYDPRQYWVGTALSGFGIVYNRDVLADLGLARPRSFRDLTDPRYFNLLALADGRLSGSITTTYDSVLNKEGWDAGWRTLREMAANARYFASAATRVPVDVSQGEAAAGLSIDFYGRGQAQFVLAAGERPGDGRVGYVDPEGATYIDADPVSIVNGAGQPELARRFVEFLLSEEAQALWQFPAVTSPEGAGNPLGESGERMGPVRYELRRMPVRRVMYEEYLGHFVDKSDPFGAASDVPLRGWRSLIGPLMAAFGIDTSEDLRAAWRGLNAARGAAGERPALRSRVAEAEEAFYAMPVHATRPGALSPAELEGLSRDAARVVAGVRPPTIAGIGDAIPGLRAGGQAKPEVVAELERLVGSRPVGEREAVLELELNETTFAAIKLDTDSWKDPVHGRRSLIRYTEFFRRQYRRVAELCRPYEG